MCLCPMWFNGARTKYGKEPKIEDPKAFRPVRLILAIFAAQKIGLYYVQNEHMW